MSGPVPVFGKRPRFAGLHRHVERDADLCLCPDCIAQDKTGRRRAQLIKERAILQRRFRSRRLMQEIADEEAVDVQPLDFDLAA
jgi:hypothetical protein